MRITTNILGRLQSVRGGFGIELVAAGLAAPLLALAVVFDLVELVRRGLVERQAFASASAICPNDHLVELVSDGWTCGTCKATVPGHAWAACVCGGRAAQIRCACGATVSNPLFESVR